MIFMTTHLKRLFNITDSIVNKFEFSPSTKVLLWVGVNELKSEPLRTRLGGIDQTLKRT